MSSIPVDVRPVIGMSIRRQRELWKPYRDAVLGFRNCWYPVCFARDLDGDRPTPVRVLGERLLLRRVDGTIHAIEDRCAHRRVRLSHRQEKGLGQIECYTRDTVTCWYHGFTYSFVTGRLVACVSWPTCPDIGRIGVRSYPVREAKGLVFVYVGDGEPGELARDVSPEFLDGDLVIEGRIRVVNANWRWGVENGFDSTHIYMHRNSILFENSKTIVPLGLVPIDRTGESASMVAEDGRAGMRENLLEAYEPVWAVDIGDPALGGAHLAVKVDSGDVTPLAPVIAAWFPCLVVVDPFPVEGSIVYEFYVPIDERSHLYFQLVGRRCETAADEEAFRHEVTTRWAHYMQDGFNFDDVVAREGLESAYTEGNGWLEEHLTAQDLSIIGWRNLASKLHRGIQKP